jgi:hypothetical protein
MSYTNPKIFATDPTAFSKGFSQTFQMGMQIYEKQKAEQDRIRQEAEQAEALLLSQTDLGGYQDLDKKIYDRFQENIKGIVDSGEFAKMSPVEKQKALFEIRDLKQGFEKFKQILAMPESELDARNSDLIELKTAIMKDPSSVDVLGSGANMSIHFDDKDGKRKQVSINGLNSTRLINKKEFEASLGKFDDGIFNQAKQILIEGAKNGKFIQAEAYATDRYREALERDLDIEEYSFIYSNKIGGTYNGSQEQKQQVIDYKLQEFKGRVDAEKELRDILAPKPETVQPGKDPRSYTQMLTDATAQQRLSQLQNFDLAPTMTGPISSQGESPKGFGKSLYKPSEESGGATATSNFTELSRKLSQLGFSVSLEDEIMKEVDGDPVYYPKNLVIKDDVRNNKRVIDLDLVDGDILKKLIEDLTKQGTSFMLGGNTSPQQGSDTSGLPIFSN